ncbi:MAG: DUF262 domain-containing protein [Candidatus Aenigmatarchaeota archaeon]
MNEISATKKSIRQLLQNTHFAVDYYQREYKWQSKQVNELINDLMEKFSSFYREEDLQSAIERYGSYFLGTIIICGKEGRKYIIDGQQRLTTITLLLIFLYNAIKNEDQRLKLRSLVFSDVYGRKTFNIDVDERKYCMEHLLRDEIVNGDSSESVNNIIGRYLDIKQSPNLSELDERKLLFFSDWLIENVFFVEIETKTDEDAYAIFESMNDRGLSLTPLDMLKGYLLSRITEQEKRNDASKSWKEYTEKVKKFGKDEDSEAFKAWLRSQYAETTRERKIGAVRVVPKDFEKIGTEFHRWVKENEEKINLKGSDDFYNFIKKQMGFYFTQYARIKNASQKLIDGLEAIYYNACLNFTLQNTLLLAPITPDDSEEIIRKKLKLVSTYLDILIARRIWNFKSISYDVMRYAIFNVVKSIRRKSIDEIRSILIDEINKENLTFDSIFYLHNMNKFYVKYILARMTTYIEKESGMGDNFDKYIAKGKVGYEIEHILANHYERFQKEFASSYEFEQYRNRLGDLLLLPKSFNASYGDMKFEDKVRHYFGQNLLAKSLHKNCYEHNPRFLAFIQRYNLPFKPYEHFGKKEIEERQELYSKIAELVWSVDRLKS